MERILMRMKRRKTLTKRVVFMAEAARLAGKRRMPFDDFRVSKRR
jgi:hypothetical protein